MVKKYRTALGRTLDMSELIARNEKTRAVGNMKVNARGDTIDSSGKIIEPVTSKVTNNYAKTVGNKTAQPVRTNKVRRPGNDPTSPKKTAVPQGATSAKPELTAYEKELEADMEDDFEVERIKAKESDN